MTSLSRSARRWLAAAAVLGMTGGALSVQAAPAKTGGAPCFFSSQWQGWKAPDPSTLLLRVNQNDIYRVGLSGPSPELQSPGVHLVFRARGTNTICSPLDLDLSVSDGAGFSEPLIARSLTKLTPEEVAAIPKKDLP